MARTSLLAHKVWMGRPGQKSKRCKPPAPLPCGLIVLTLASIVSTVAYIFRRKETAAYGKAKKMNDQIASPKNRSRSSTVSLEHSNPPLDRMAYWRRKDVTIPSRRGLHLGAWERGAWSLWTHTTA